MLEGVIVGGSGGDYKRMLPEEVAIGGCWKGLLEGFGWGGGSGKKICGDGGLLHFSGILLE